MLKKKNYSIGMPVHSPPYAMDNLKVKFELMKIGAEVRNVDPLIQVVPEPLKIAGNEVIFVTTRVLNFDGELALYVKDLPWNEMLIQIPVTYKNDDYNFLCNGWIDNPGIMIIDREVFGQPKIFADININKTVDGKIEACAKYYKNEKSIFSSSFITEGNASPLDLKNSGKVVCLKYIPSSEMNKLPEVNKLITLEYKNRKLLSLKKGKGDIKLGEHIPEYIKKAEIKEIKKSFLIELELVIDKGGVLYDYKHD